MSSLKAQILAELEWRGALPKGDPGKLRADYEADGGNPLAFLVERGVNGEDALQAASTAAGLTAAPRALLQRPAPPRIDVPLCLAHGGVPIGERGGTPCVAFSDPDRALDAALHLPPHLALLALPADHAHAEAHVRSVVGEGDAFDERATFATGGGAVGLPTDAATEAYAAGAGDEDAPRLADEDDRTVVGFELPPELRDEPPPRVAAAARPRPNVERVVTTPVVVETVVHGQDDDSAEPFRDERTVVTDLSHHSQEEGPGRRRRGLPAEALDGPTDASPPAPRGPTLRAPSLASSQTSGSADDDDDEPLFDDDDVEAASDVPTIATTSGPFTDREPGGAGDNSSWLPGNPALAAAVAADQGRRGGGDFPVARPPTAAIEREAAGFDDGDSFAFGEQEPVLNTAALHVDTSVNLAFAEPPVLDVADADTVQSALEKDPGSGFDIGSHPTPPPSRRGTSADDTGAVTARTEPKTPASAPRGARRRPSSPALDRASVDRAAPTVKTGSGSGEDEASRQQAALDGIPRYKPLRVLGRGGMATVYLAEDQETGREVALKILEAHLSDDYVFIERFRREVMNTQNLDHRNIVRVFDHGESGDTHFMATEYVDGGTLSDLLRKCGPMPAPMVLSLMTGALSGLDYAHAQGTIHRDLKPANLMLTTEGVMKIGDFGIAKASTDETLTKTGTLFGTPAYMSPEQAMGRSIDHRSDLFSIGVVFYQLLTGVNPFHSENPSTSLFKISSGQFPPLFSVCPELPTLLEAVVMRLLSVDRDQRFPSGQAALDTLSPLIKLVQAQYPDVIANAIRTPKETVEAVRKRSARSQLEHARANLRFDPPRKEAAAFRMFLATRMDSSNYEATNELTQLRLEEKYCFEPEVDPRIVEVQEALRRNKPTAALLRRAHDLHAAQRDLWGMARYLKQYLGFMPHDEHMKMRLVRLLGTDHFAPYSEPPRPRPVSIAPEAANDIVPGLRPAGSGAEVRGAAKPAALTGAAARAAVAASSSTSSPGIPVTDIGDDEVVIVQTGPDASRPGSEEGDAPSEAHGDSFDQLLAFLRDARAEILRSVTGDQGVEGLRQWWRDRFNQENAHEIKEQAQQLLGTSKQALAKGKQQILDEKNREKVKVEAVSAWRRHRRILILAGAVLGLLWLLKLGCGLAIDAALSRDEPPKSMGSKSGGGRLDIEE